MSKIYYLCYYSNHEKGRWRDSSPASDLQISYLTEMFQKLGYEVEVIAANIPEESEHIFHRQDGFIRKLDTNIAVRYFPCIESKIHGIRGLSRRLVYLRASRYLKKLPADSLIVIYHSRIFYPYYSFLKKNRKKYILELEEIYSDVIDDDNLRKKEVHEIKKADAYILPSIPLAEEISDGKKCVLYHGSCRREKKIGNGFQDGRIHIVYAGTFDYRVVGKMSMIYAAKFLDERYHIHIIGFGNESDKKRVLDAVQEMQNLPCRVSYDGLLLGDDYLEFLQNCDAGIFSREPNSRDINSSFPSKIMSYLGNGLRVIATRADSIERSDVANLMYFMDSNEPEEVARVIKSIDFTEPFEGRHELEKIEKRLENRMADFLMECRREEL